MRLLSNRMQRTSSSWPSRTRRHPPHSMSHKLQQRRNINHWTLINAMRQFSAQCFLSHVLNIHYGAPSYLSDLCVPVSATTARSFLRSSSRGDLMIPRCRLRRFGSRSFAVCGPTAWNSLQAAVRDFCSSSSSSCFCGHLKSELFCRAYGVDSP